MPNASSSWIAVSDVIAALPLMISLMVLSGRAVRRASSACVIPRSCKASRRISPGGTAHWGSQPSRESLAMVVNHLLDFDLGHQGDVDAAVRQGGHGVVGRSEHQPVRTPEAERKFPGSSCAERVTITGHAGHVGESRRAEEGCQSALEDLPVVQSPMLAALAVVGAGLLQLAAGPRDLDGRLLDIFTPGGNLITRGEG